MTSTIQDPSGYDTPTLVKWYIDLRNHKSEIKRSIEPAIAQVENQMDAIESELNKRIVTSGVKSMRTENGTITRVNKTKYLVTDSYAFREWLKLNPEVGSQLISASITQGEVMNYLSDGNALPDGLTVENSIELSVRRT